MDMQGSERIEAPVETVWRALNDPEILKQAIPGCESLEMTSDTTMAARVVLKIGPIKAKFEGAVELQNLNPPNSYTISGEGKGGLAGFAKGGADVTLTADSEGATLLSYTVKAEVGGKIAQLGSRLIESTSKKLAGEFFSNFSAAVTARDAQAEA
jgi:carbon monoxide dehydrogenase subunit G